MSRDIKQGAKISWSKRILPFHENILTSEDFLTDHTNPENKTMLRFRNPFQKWSTGYQLITSTLEKLLGRVKKI